MVNRKRENIKIELKKQLNSIEYLIEHNKYGLAKQITLKELEKYPNCIELKKKLLTTNHYLDNDLENIELLKQDIEDCQAESIKATLFETYYYLYNYDKAYELLDDFMEGTTEKKLRDYRIYEIVIMKKLGMEIHLHDFEQNDYILNQILNYDINNFFKHMTSIVKYFNSVGIELNHDNNYTDIVKQIKNSIEQASRSKILRPTDIYFFNYPHFAYNKELGKYVNNMRVKCIPGTYDILFIDPVKEKNMDICNKLDHINRCDYHSPYVLKRKTQIDKFYSRYQR